MTVLVHGIPIGHIVAKGSQIREQNVPGRVCPIDVALDTTEHVVSVTLNSKVSQIIDQFQLLSIRFRILFEKSTPSSSLKTFYLSMRLIWTTNFLSEKRFGVLRPPIFGVL